MRLWQVVDEIQPRTAFLTGVLFAGIFIVVSSPEPMQVLQVLSALAGIGSFLIAARNHSAEEAGQDQAAQTRGDGPQTVIQIGDVKAPINMEGVGQNRKPKEADEREGEERN